MLWVKWQAMLNEIPPYIINLNLQITLLIPNWESFAHGRCMVFGILDQSVYFWYLTILVNDQSYFLCTACTVVQHVRREGSSKGWFTQNYRQVANIYPRHQTITARRTHLHHILTEVSELIFTGKCITFLNWSLRAL